MVQFIKHRINKIDELNDINPEWGVEIDLRSNPSNDRSIYLHHDPWQKGDSFSDWLDRFNELGISGPIILNTKEDGLEESILGTLREKKVSDYFFLDTAFPTLIHWSLKKNIHDFAIRVSTFEDGDFALKHKDKIDWIWVDCFDCEVLSAEHIEKHFKGIKKCLVSPELQNFSLDCIGKFSDLANVCDAICTKAPGAWSGIIQR